MFGYAHPTIAKLIQEMPGAELCKVYQPQQFVPMSAKSKTSTEPRFIVFHPNSRKLAKKVEESEKRLLLTNLRPARATFPSLQVSPIFLVDLRL